MTGFDSKGIRFLARLRARGVLGQALYDLAEEGTDFYAVSADLCHASGYDRLAEKYPERLVNVGIAEQNLVGVAAGLSYTGKPVVATSWAMFASARVADQVRNFMGFMGRDVKLVGMESGLAEPKLGYSHTNPPDIAVMRAIPGVTVLSPCDGLEVYSAVRAAMKHRGPVYIRLPGERGGVLPPVYTEDTDFTIGRAKTVREGEDVAIIACGNMVRNALDAAAELEAAGFSAKVVDMHTLSPLDTGTLDSLTGYRLLATVEDHLLRGGLGGAVAEYYCGKAARPRQLMFGIDDSYPAPGSARYTEENAGLSPRRIAERIAGELKNF